MRLTDRKHWIACFIVGLVCTMLSGAALAQAGKAIFVSGQVQVERGVTLALAKGDDVEVGDVVITGDRSRVQLLMADGAKIAIRPNSRYRIDEYVFRPEPTTAAPAAAPAGPSRRSVATLIKGGFRTITGLIGQEDETEYEVNTPVGTLGIRGTDYTAVWCSGDCVTAPGVAGAGLIPDGLYLGVTAGIIFFRNNVMTIELHAGQFAYIPAADAEPVQLLVPPTAFYETPEADFERPPTDEQARPDDDDRPPGADEDEPPPGTAAEPGTPTGSSFEATVSSRRSPPPSSAPLPELYDKLQFGFAYPPAQPVLATDPSGNPANLTGGTAPPQPATMGFSFFDENRNEGYASSADNLPGEILSDAQGNPIQFRGDIIDATAGIVGATYSIGTATNLDSGFDPTTKMRWGRWSGGMAVVLPDNTTISRPLDLTAQSLHWIDGADRLNPPTLPQTGTATYSLIGSTNPTDDRGNVGVLGSASFSADFTNQNVSSTVDLTVGGNTVNAAGVGTIGGGGSLPPHQFDGVYTSVLVNGMPTGNGSFQGFFTGPASGSGGLPAGAGLTYTLNQPGAVAPGFSVSGALAFAISTGN